MIYIVSLWFLKSILLISGFFFWSSLMGLLFLNTENYLLLTGVFGIVCLTCAMVIYFVIANALGKVKRSA